MQARRLEIKVTHKYSAAEPSQESGSIGDRKASPSASLIRIKGDGSHHDMTTYGTAKLAASCCKCTKGTRPLVSGNLFSRACSVTFNSLAPKDSEAASARNKL